MALYVGVGVRQSIEVILEKVERRVLGTIPLNPTIKNAPGQTTTALGP